MIHPSAERNRSRQTPPEYCQFAQGRCDQDLASATAAKAIFLYPSQPAHIAATIETAKNELNRLGTTIWRSWTDLPIHGRLIFCEICKGIRAADLVVADITTLNFNVMFEIGFAVGLGIPVLPIRDSTYDKDHALFEQIGVFETLGHFPFQNANTLVTWLSKDPSPPSLPSIPKRTYPEAPIYVLKGPHDTQGALQLLYTLNSAHLRHRTFDQDEHIRLTLSEARRQVGGSYGVIANLLSTNRSTAPAHNALCAFLCGIAVAEGKVVSMLQEEDHNHPIDYRDIIRTYADPRDITTLLSSTMQGVVDRLQAPRHLQTSLPLSPLESADLGDPAAENEVAGLAQYFVKTGIYNSAKQRTFRVILGRKGSGKTALFYAIRNESEGPARVILDFRPEGHQFSRLRDAVHSQLTQGLQEHTLVAFWHYILLCELAHEVLSSDVAIARRDGFLFTHYERLDREFKPHSTGAGELSQRLMRQVDRLTERVPQIAEEGLRGDVTQYVYADDIRPLSEALSDYLLEKNTVTLLVDNLDKSWRIRQTTATDVLILRCLITAARKLQRDLADQGVEFRCLIFLRTDVFDHLIEETSDQGKESHLRIDWDDPEIFREILRRRISASSGRDATFEEHWTELAVEEVRGQPSFGFLLERTMMRPRDLIGLAQRSFEVAIGRGHSRIAEEDFLQAAKSYSDDMLLAISYEIGDLDSRLSDAIYELHGGPSELSWTNLESALRKGGIEEPDIDDSISTLLWFAVVGVVRVEEAKPRFSYELKYNLRPLLSAARDPGARFVVHPAYRPALGIC